MFVFEPPSSISADAMVERAARPSAEVLLTGVLEEFDLVEAFALQDVHTLDEAAELTVDDIRTILTSKGIAAPTVGLVRRIASRISAAAEACVQADKARRELGSVATTPSSVLPRALLRLPACELKDALATRLTAENIYASLLLTVTVAALLTPPTSEDMAVCAKSYNSTALCEGLQQTYVLSWGMAAAGFLNSCTVGLGAMQLFTGVASNETVHFTYVQSEHYIALSFGFICIGFVSSMVGVNMLVLLRFAKYPITSWICVVFLWLLWAISFASGNSAISGVYSTNPGFTSVAKFMLGYFKSATLKPDHLAASITRTSTAKTVLRKKNDCDTE